MTSHFEKGQEHCSISEASQCPELYPLWVKNSSNDDIGIFTQAWPISMKAHYYN